MCGIAGIIDFDHRPIEPSLLLAMNQAIAHRGPDDEGYVLIDRSISRSWEFAGSASIAAARARLPLLSHGPMSSADIALSHRRFSIIDLSDAGHQPFFDQERSVCVVFNGEIYNYIELRMELEAAGVVFR